jgi:hypothetical protein
MTEVIEGDAPAAAVAVVATKEEVARDVLLIIWHAARAVKLRIAEASRDRLREIELLRLEITTITPSQCPETDHAHHVIAQLIQEREACLLDGGFCFVLFGYF